MKAAASSRVNDADGFNERKEYEALLSDEFRCKQDIWYYQFDCYDGKDLACGTHKSEALSKDLLSYVAENSDNSDEAVFWYPTLSTSNGGRFYMRVLVAETASPNSVVSMLRKVADSIERDNKLLDLYKYTDLIGTVDHGVKRL